MFTELTGVIFTFLLTLLIAFPLGGYISRVYRGGRTLLDFMGPLERCIYWSCSIGPTKKMSWKEFLKAMLTINLLWFIYAFVLFLYQGKLPRKPDGNPSM